SPRPPLPLGWEWGPAAAGEHRLANLAFVDEAPAEGSLASNQETAGSTPVIRSMPVPTTDPGTHSSAGQSAVLSKTEAPGSSPGVCTGVVEKPAPRQGHEPEVEESSPSPAATPGPIAVPHWPPSSSGPGCCAFTAATPVRTRLGASPRAASCGS